MFDTPPVRKARHASDAARRLCAAFGGWLAFLLVSAALSLWSFHGDMRDTEARLSGEAGRTAAQLAGMLSSPSLAGPDSLTVRALAAAAMEDQSIYAIKVQIGDSLLEGLRRNYQWDPVPWDGDVVENSVQGMNLLKVRGRPVGSVEVYVSPRLGDEELAQKARREILRFVLTALAATLCLLALLRHWGDLSRLRRRILARLGRETPEAEVDAVAPQDPVEADAPDMAAERPDGGAEPAEDALEAGAVVSAELGRAFLLRRPEAWRITAGLFAQTFQRAPELMLRLHGAGDVAGLCRLGDLLERAAPSVGAERLAAAAHAMQTALNDQGGASASNAVDVCVVALRETLDALRPSRG